MAIERAPFDGASISRLIKGGWQLHEAAGRLDRESALADMHAFADAGMSVFETSDSYTGVDRLIGAFLAERRARDLSPVRVHARLSVPAAAASADTALAVADIAARLGVARLDLLQLSMWAFDAARFQAAAEHATRLVTRLGVMNVDADAIATLEQAGIRVASAQAQFSLIDRRAERTLLPACRREGRAFFGYGALAGGFISNRWLGRPDPGIAGAQHPEYRVMIGAFGGWALFQRLLGVLARVAARHDVNIGTIALRWALDRPGVTAMLVGASSTAHLAQLARLRAVALDDADHATIDAVLADGNQAPGGVGAFERQPDGAMARAIAARR